MTVDVRRGYALRAPWYELEREIARDRPPEVLAAVAGRPVIQKYATADYVDVLLADPRDSLAFDPVDDVWSYPVPAGAVPRSGAGRAGLATHRLVRTPLRKLYQPNHDRFYAVVVELFCDVPGLPLPGAAAGVDVRLVVRRERTVVPAGARDRHAAEIRGLARRVLAASAAGGLPVPTDDADLEDVLWTSSEVRRQYEAEFRALLTTLGARQVVEGWVQEPGAAGQWVEVPDDDATGPALLPGELEQSMWRVPVGAEECGRASHRGLWFGLVPTLSGEVDATGAPKLDDRSVYTVRCFARRQPERGRVGCPPVLSWSEPSRPYRLAAFFDPEGTRHRTTTVAAPDLRALAARAGEPQGGGGLQVVRPPGSQLSFTSDGKGIPTGGSVGGTAAETCTYAIQLLMIVAMFVFAVFMPIVMFLFQLWWLLLLRFCWPPGAAFQALDDHFAKSTTNTLQNLPEDVAKSFDEAVGVPGAAAALKNANIPGTDPPIPRFTTNAAAKQWVAALKPTTPTPKTPTDPEPEVTDPLCDNT